MSKTATNLIVVLGLVTIAFAGYYLYVERFSTTLDFEQNDQVMENMLNNTRVFIERRQQLDQISLQLEFFEDDRFQSLRSYSTPIQERPIGRTNPFAAATVVEQQPVSQ